MPRKDGTVTRTFTFDGKRYYVTGKNEVEAEVKKAMKLRDLQEGKNTINEHMKVSTWANTVLETYMSGVSPETYRRYKSRMKCCVTDYLGDYAIKDVKPIHCQNVLNQLAEKNMSAYQIKEANRLLFNVFEKAVDNGMILKNPAKNLIKPKGSVTKRRSLTPKEEQIFLQVCSTNKRYNIFLAMYYCGCRSEEARFLECRDVQKINNQFVLRIRGTKTEASDRTVPLPEDFRKLLDIRGPFEPLCPNTVGKQLNELGFRRCWHSLIRDMNLAAGCKMHKRHLVPPYPIATDLVPYCLRHTFCTNLQKGNVDLRVAQKLMGHTDIKITSNIYTHVDTDSIIKAGKKMENYRKKSDKLKKTV